MKFFLKLKHWQLFLLSWGLPMIIAFFTIRDPTLMFNLFPYQVAFFGIFTFGWIWAIGDCLHSRLPPGVNLNLNAFRIMFAIPMLYIAGLLIWLQSGPDDPGPGIAFIILPLHLTSMVMIFLCMRFAAKTLKSIELGRMAKLGDYIGEFILIWFMPLGVWFLQPRLNKLVEVETTGLVQ